MTHLLDILITAICITLTAVLAAYVDLAPVSRWMRSILFAVPGAPLVMFATSQAAQVFGTEWSWWAPVAVLLALPLVYTGYVWVYKALWGRPVMRHTTVQTDVESILDELLKGTR